MNATYPKAQCTTRNPLIPAHLGPLTWSVPSATKRGLSYEVRADSVTGELRCNCAARRVCWHVKAVASGAMGKPHIRVRPQPPRRPVPAVTTAEVNGALYGGA